MQYLAEVCKMYNPDNTNDGYLIHQNKQNSMLLKDDPRLMEILFKINIDHCDIKNNIYRCAAKLICLQKVLYTQRIPFSSIIVILEHHRLGQTENAPGIRPAQLTNVLHDIFYASEKTGILSDHPEFDVDQATSALSNFIWNIFDPERVTPISIIELRQTLLMLCETASFEDFVVKMFEFVADHNRCVTRFKFKNILKNCSKIFSYLDDTVFFGPHVIPEIVDASFRYCPGMVGFNEFQFLNLMNQSSNNFVNVLCLMKHLQDSRNLIHSVACASCGIRQIEGVGFRCGSCKQLFLCFCCAAKGYLDKKHSHSHKLTELRTIELEPTKFSQFCKKVRRLLSCRKRNSSLPPKLPEEASQIQMVTREIIAEEIPVTLEMGHNDTKFSTSTMTKNSTQMFFNACSNAGRQSNQSCADKLPALIDLILHENSSLHKLIDNSANSSENKELLDFLRKHEVVLTAIAEQLRSVWQKSSALALPNSSTPYRVPNKRLQLPIQQSSMVAKSIHGIEVNHTFLEEAKSDYSISDVSNWFHDRRLTHDFDALPPLNEVDTQMKNFKELLNKVREIIDDSFSENCELSDATHQLERVLDNIIGEEEIKRQS